MLQHVHSAREHIIQTSDPRIHNILGGILLGDTPILPHQLSEPHRALDHASLDVVGEDAGLPGVDVPHGIEQVRVRNQAIRSLCYDTNDAYKHVCMGW